MVCSCSLTPHFVNNDYVTAEIIYSTAYACHEVLAWSRTTLWYTHVWAVPRKQWHLWPCHGCVPWVSQERRECSVSVAMAAAAARREKTCLQFLRLLESPSSLLAPTLPILGSTNSADSVNRKTLASQIGSAIQLV